MPGVLGVVAVRPRPSQRFALGHPASASASASAFPGRRLLIFTLFWKVGSNLAPDNLTNIAGAGFIITYVLWTACPACAVAVRWQGGSCAGPLQGEGKLSTRLDQQLIGPHDCPLCPAAVLFMWTTLPAFGAAAYVPNIVLERALFVR